MPRWFYSWPLTNIDIGGIDEMEILFSIIAGIFAILASVFGVRNRIKNSRIGTRGGIRNSRERLDDLVSNHKRLERDKKRVGELDKRDDENIRRCKDIVERLRKREPETDVRE